MVFMIFHSHTFDKALEKMPKDFQELVNKVENQLVENPYVGDQIRVPWFREKKKDNSRIYYLIYEELNRVYLVAISDKKDQKAVINSIWIFLDQFKEEIKDLVRE